MANTPENSGSSSVVNVNAPVFDWSATPLANCYNGFYLKVLDDFFTSEECAALIALAESDDNWKQAAVHYGIGAHENYVNTDYRNSERILRFDHEAAEKLYQRLLPYVQELVEIKPGDKWERIIGQPGHVRGTWKLVGYVQILSSLILKKKEKTNVKHFCSLNERLSFLRYEKGNYFRGHCDGQLELPDGRKSRVTLQIYLGDEEVEGGATRISRGYRDKEAFVDIEPKKGRVLIFQQRGLFHSGEDVTKGVKYAVRSDFMFKHTEDS